MKKIFTQRLFYYMLAALVITITAIFCLQTAVNRADNTRSSQAKLEDVRQKLASNEANIAQLTENLSQDNLAKTRAFADMLAADRSIFGNADKLDQIRERLMVNELHIIDADGIITSSTIDAYIGFDMKSGEQSNAFMVIVDDTSIEIVQEPQVNVAEGIVMQYIGVARTDDKGLVQVGVRPEVLERTLAGTELSVVLKDIDFGENGYIYAIDTTSGLILAHNNASLVGTPAADAGFPSNLTGRGKAVIDGTKGYYVAESCGDKVIGTFMPAGEYYAGRRSQTIVVSLSMMIIFGVLLLMISHMVDSKIVRGINRISSSMHEIAVDEQGNPEFIMLSDSINKMVAGIQQSIRENESLLTQQIQDMEHNKLMIQNIKNACRDLNAVSGETLENAENIFNGTGEQEKAVEDLKLTMDQLTEELNNSVNASASVTAATGTTSDKILQTQSRMQLLTDSMQKISDMSMKIEKIIGEIDSIAQQTNMLSLNASIEAARAGDMGRGFAVVARQVGALATRSAQAARETTELIMNSISAVEDGRAITEQTVEAFDIVVENIEQTDHNIAEITSMVRQNVDIVAHAVSQIERISGVVEDNVRISQDTKQVSANMADITGKLLGIVES